MQRFATHKTHLENSALSPRQLGALPAIVGSQSQAQAARSAGIDRSTLYRWLQDQDFRQELSRLREESAALARTELQASMLHAVNVILDSTNSDNEIVRLRAARSLLNLGLKVNEIEKPPRRTPPPRKVPRIHHQHPTPNPVTPLTTTPPIPNLPHPRAHRCAP